LRNISTNKTRIKSLFLENCNINDNSNLLFCDSLEEVFVSLKKDINILLKLKNSVNITKITLFSNKDFSDRLFSEDFKDIFASFSKLKYLSISQIGFSDLSSLSNCTSLEELSLNEGVHISNLNFLVNLPNLRKLELQVSAKIPPLAGCTSLEEIEIINPSLNNISFLNECISLQKLAILNDNEIKDISSLESCTNLRFILVENCSNITSLLPLTNLTKLETLILKQYSGNIVFPEKVNLISLKEINLEYCLNITNITFLENCTNIEKVRITCCSQLTDLSPLANCLNLRDLDLSDCLQITDLSPLIRCLNLRDLDIEGCFRIRNLSPLIHCINLVTLNIVEISNLDLRPLILCQELSKIFVTCVPSLIGFTELKDNFHKRDNRLIIYHG
jgi:internalin A